MEPTKVGLGDRARDTITGFQGIVIGITDWLANCRRIGIQPEELKDGKPLEAVWFDEPHVELVGSTAHSIAAAPATGGPMPAPTRAADPGR